jgi:multimeric flavodoxin WrbA
MTATILDGAAALRDVADPVLAALRQALEARGHSVTHHDLPSLEIPPCKGDFGCWTATPGLCVQPGPHRDVARDLVQSDLAVWLTPITFGGYSSALKRQLDHCVPLVLPWMQVVDGETHHPGRYERFPKLLAIGLAETPDPAEARIFERLVQRNVLNMHAPRWTSVVVARGEVPRLAASVPGWLAALERSQPPRVAAEPLELHPLPDLPATPARRALLVVGSPRGRASVSNAIASYLEALLSQRGISVVTELLHQRERLDGPSLGGLAARLEEADLVALVAPLYVDSLPAPVTRALEVLAAARARAAAPARLLAIVNCGFPEAVHTDTALAICRAFARRASLDWIGGLGIGGGGLLAGKPLAELGGRARFVTRALELTADAVARGEIVPAEARLLARDLPTPACLYRLIADWSFGVEARKHGIRERLDDRPDAT